MINMHFKCIYVPILVQKEFVNKQYLYTVSQMVEYILQSSYVFVWDNEILPKDQNNLLERGSVKFQTKLFWY